MFFVILMILHGIVSALTEHTVDFKMSSDLHLVLKENITYPVIFEGEPIHINIYSRIPIIDIWCRYGHGLRRALQIKDKKRDSEKFSFTVYHIAKDHSVWFCNFIQREYTAPSHLIRFHIRTKLPRARMYVNNCEVCAVTTALAVMAYDAVAYYTFAVGETATIDCIPRLDIGEVVTSYYNNTDSSFVVRNKNTSNWEPNDNEISTFNPLLIKLTKNYDAKYVECKYNDGFDVSVTRLIFKLQNPDTPQSIITLKINGMKVNVGPSNDTKHEYTLLYHDGEAVDIDVSLQNSDNSSLLVNYNGIEHFLSYYYYKTVQLTKANDGEVMQIIATDSKFKIQLLNITFKQHFSDLFLTDINKGHILKQYKLREGSSVVHYQYLDNETFSICSSLSNKLLCYDNTGKLNMNEKMLKDSMGHKIIVMLGPENNGSNINCIIKRKGQKDILEQLHIKLIHFTNYNPPNPIFIKDESLTSWIPWTVSLLILIFVITVIPVFVIMKKKKKEQCTVTNNENLLIQFANMYPVDGPEEESEVEREQEPLPHTSQGSNHCAESNDTTIYSDVYYEPSFPGRKTPSCTENDYVYVDCAHLGERHESAFDAVATRMALEKAKRSNKNEYSNLEELCRPGKCVMRDNTHK